MHKFPEFIETYLSEHLNNGIEYGILQLNKLGRILNWQGDIARFNQQLPEPYMEIYSYCVTLEGILPLDTTPTVLPRIEIIDNIFADIHLIEYNKCYWIFFIDSTKEVNQIRKTIQDHNNKILKNKKLQKPDKE